MPENGTDASSSADLDSASTSSVDETNQSADLTEGSEGSEDNTNDQAGNSEEEGGASGDTTGDDSEDEASLPFHKHPRWIKQRQELRETKEKLKALEASKTSNQTTQPTKSTVNLSEVDKMFEGLPEHEFKPASEYKDVKALYRDIRNAVIADLTGVQQKTKDSNEQLLNHYNKVLDGIKEDLGDPKLFTGFVDFAQKTLEKHPNTSLEVMRDFFLESYASSQPTEKVKEKREPSKINKSVQPGSSKSGAPNQEYLRNRSMQEIMDEQLRMKQK